MGARYIVAAAIVLGGFTIIGWIFWAENYRYSLPTPVPDNYEAVAVGTDVSNALRSAGIDGKAAFLHFYNPDCPCSRFNARHLKSLIRKHGNEIQLQIVVPDHDAKEQAREEFGEQLTYITDAGHKLAKDLGVYSTPQAVITDKSGRLYYRGNYNRSRYCTSRASNYAELALISFLENKPSPVFDIFATQAYGCELDESPGLSKLNF